MPLGSCQGPPAAVTYGQAPPMMPMTPPATPRRGPPRTSGAEAGSVWEESRCCRAVPPGARRRTEPEVVYRRTKIPSSVPQRRRSCGRVSPQGREGRNSFWKAESAGRCLTRRDDKWGHRAILRAAKGRLGQRYLRAIFKQMGYGGILL